MGISMIGRLLLLLDAYLIYNSNGLFKVSIISIGARQSFDFQKEPPSMYSILDVQLMIFQDVITMYFFKKEGL